MNLLKYERTKKGMTQAEVADRCGIQRALYAHYETGRRMPKPQTVMKIADVLDFVWSDFYEKECNDEGRI